jgi:hypothetical protein
MDRATKRILELAKEGLSDSKIADELEVEGFKNEKGELFDRNSVHSRRLRAQRKVIRKTPALPEEWKSQIIQIVREEIQAMMESQMLPKDRTELAPKLSHDQKVMDPKSKRKKGPARRPKIAGTVDPELIHRFEEWRKERGLTLSHGLDTVLWHFFDKPKLSFEISDKSEESDND